jgi:hypothetical protein
MVDTILIVDWQSAAPRPLRSRSERAKIPPLPVETPRVRWLAAEVESPRCSWTAARPLPL